MARDDATLTPDLDTQLLHTWYYIVARRVISRISPASPPFRALSSPRRASASAATAGLVDAPSQRRSACFQASMPESTTDLRNSLRCQRFGEQVHDRANACPYVFPVYPL